MKIEDLIAAVTIRNVSDILIAANDFPRIRKNGVLSEEKEWGKYSGREIDEFRIRVLGEEGEKEYQLNDGADASLALSAVQRCRINFFTTVNGPGMAVRPLRNGDQVTFEDSSLPDTLKELCAASRGLILVTGATGSGKTTTLSAMVNYINRNFFKHILKIEDPAEYLHSNIRSMVTQREIRNGSSGGFQNALRFALRENPDVIVIGEIRDIETMQTAMHAALTGHLVIATLHTTDTILSIERIIGLYPENYRQQAAQDLSLSLTAILSQRLLPKAGGDGVLPVMEILLGTPTVKKQIAERDLEALELTLRSGRHQGMITFNRALAECFQEGRISLETAIGASSNPDEFKLLIRGMENGSASLIPHYVTEEEEDGDREQVCMRTLLRTAVRNKASDLILTVGLPPLLKVNGVIMKVDLPSLGPEDVERLVFGLITRRQRVVLEEKRELDFGIAARLPKVEEGKKETVCRFRINAFFQRGTLGMVARIVNSRIPTAAELGLPAIFSEFVRKKQGLVVVTGPTGSGKSTTLASLIEEINLSRSCHIVTIEDPVEYVYENKRAVIEQRELHSDTLSFATALRAALREAPDVILVGEMRDVETMAAALTAAETGHLVLATLHTNSASQTVERIVDSFPAAQQNQIRQQLAASLLAVISQRLLPRRDREGMVAAFEVMVGTPPVAALIRENKTHLLQSTLETGFKDGMQTMAKSLQELYATKKISLEDVKLYEVDQRQVKSF